MSRDDLLGGLVSTYYERNETEFSRVLQVMERKDSTLSSIVRQAFDTSDLRIMTKTNPIDATVASCGK